MQPCPPWHQLLLAAALLTLTSTLPLAAEVEEESAYARTWTRQSGETFKASFIGTDGDNVIVETLPDRTRYTIAIEHLSAPDRGYIHSRQSGTGHSSSSASASSSRFSLPFSSLGKGLFRSSKSKTESLQLAASSRINGTPDFLQTHRSARLPLSGSQHCGPVAAANALTYLSLTAFPQLSPPGNTPHDRQVTLIRSLSSAAFMRTDSSGTSPWNLVAGLDSFVRFRGCSPRKLEFQGWQPVPRRYTSRHKIPHLKSARDTLAKPKSAVLVNIGFYRANNNLYTRQDGHWITAVGFKDDHTILAYDPSPRAGSKKTLHEITLAPLPHGALDLATWEDPVSTVGYYQFTSPYPVPNRKLTTIIDGFVLLELR